MASYRSCDYCGCRIHGDDDFVTISARGTRSTGPHALDWGPVRDAVGDYHATPEADCYGEMVEKVRLVHSVTSAIEAIPTAEQESTIEAESTVQPTATIEAESTVQPTATVEPESVPPLPQAKADPQDERLTVSIGCLDLSVRTDNLLTRGGYETTGQIVEAWQNGNLWRLAGFGEKTRSEVRTALEKLWIELEHGVREEDF
jgi:DNA-directed RNA polymerase alpha subunit